MNQIELCVAAKQQQGLTSDNQLALRLGVDRSRVSKLIHGKAPADEAEICMLAEMAKIDVRLALAAVHKDREKNPAKAEFWRKLQAQFAAVLLALALIWQGVAPNEAHAKGELPSYKLCEVQFIAASLRNCGLPTSHRK